MNMSIVLLVGVQIGCSCRSAWIFSHRVCQRQWNLTQSFCQKPGTCSSRTRSVYFWLPPSAHTTNEAGHEFSTAENDDDEKMNTKITRNTIFVHSDEDGFMDRLPLVSWLCFSQPRGFLTRFRSLTSPSFMFFSYFNCDFPPSFHSLLELTTFKSKTYFVFHHLCLDVISDILHLFAEIRIILESRSSHRTLFL